MDDRCTPCTDTTRSNKIDVVTVDIKRSVKRLPTSDSTDIGILLAATEQSISPEASIELMSVSPFGLNGNIITNGNFGAGLDGWAVYNASWMNPGVQLQPDEQPSISQNITADPLKFYKLSFNCVLQGLPSDTEVDGFVKVEIVDQLTNVVIFSNVELVNNKVCPKYYNISNISTAIIKFYAINKNILLTNVEITDGPLMYSLRTNNQTTLDFNSNNGDLVSVDPNLIICQDDDKPNGILLTPKNETNFQKLNLIVSNDGFNTRLDYSQSFVDYSSNFKAGLKQIRSIDYGYESHNLTYYVADVSNNPLKRISTDGTISVINTSSYFPVAAIKKHATEPILWLGQGNASYVHELDLNNPSFPKTYGYNLDINIEAIAHAPLAKELYVIGVDWTYGAEVYTSVYRFDLFNFNVATKIFTKKGYYKSIECVSDSTIKNAIRVVIGASNTLDPGTNDGNDMFIILDRDGVVDFSFNVPDIQSCDHISAAPYSASVRYNYSVIVTDKVGKSVYTLNVANRYFYKHFYEGEPYLAISGYFKNPTYAVKRTISTNKDKWYVIDTDVVDGSWSDAGPLSWSRPLTISTSDGRISKADTGQSGSDVTYSDATSPKKSSDNLFSRILYRPSGDSVDLILDCGDDVSTNLDQSPIDNTKTARILGVSVAEIDLASITPRVDNQTKDLSLFNDGVDGWYVDNTIYDNVTKSVKIPEYYSGKSLTKTFKVKPFKLIRFGINLNINSLDNTTASVEIRANGVKILSNNVGEYDNIVSKTGYFEVDFVSKTSDLTITVNSTNGVMSTNYMCLCYYEPSTLYDPCSVEDVKVKLSLQGVPIMPYNIFGVALRYTLRDYFDPTVRGTVTVFQRDLTTDPFKIDSYGCYGWSKWPQTNVNPISGNLELLKTAYPGNLVDTTNFSNIIWPRYSQNVIKSTLPNVTFSFPNYYEDYSLRVTSGSPQCTQTESSPIFKPSVIEAVDVLILTSCAPNLTKSYSLFGSGCGSKQFLDVGLEYVKPVGLKTYNTSFNLLNSLQVNGGNFPGQFDGGLNWDVGNPALLKTARWESFRVTLDLPSGGGSDQCTVPIEGFAITGGGSLKIGNIFFSPSRGGGVDSGDGCVVNVIVDTISDGSLTQAKHKITLDKPDNGTWRIIYGDTTSADSTESLKWDATADDIYKAMSKIPSLGPDLIEVSGSFPVYVITYDPSLKIVPDISIINNLTCTKPPLGYVDPGPYVYDVDVFVPNMNVDPPDTSCELCYTYDNDELIIRRFNTNENCISSDCTTPMRSLACRFGKYDGYDFYAFDGGVMRKLEADYIPVAGDKIVIVDGSISGIDFIAGEVGRSLSRF